MVGSHEVAGSSDSKIILSNGVNSGCFQPHISQNVAISMSSLTRQSYGDSLLAICLARQVGIV